MCKTLPVVFLFILLANSCAGNKSTQGHLAPDKVFNIKDTLKAEVMPHEIWGNFVSKILYTEKGLICCTTTDGYIVQLIDPETGKLISSAGKIGRGPKEFLGPMVKDIDRISNTVYVFDVQRRELVPFTYSDGRIEQLPSIDYFDDPDCSGYVKINNNRWIILNNSHNGYLKLIDTLGNVLDSLPNAVLSEEVQNIKFNTALKGSVDKSCIMLYEADLPIFRKYSIKKDKLILDYRIEYLKPVFRLSNRGYVVDKKQMMGILGNYLTEKYHYMIHPGLSFEQFTHYTRQQTTPDYIYVLVYDLDGNFKKSILLDRFFWSMTISDDDRYLYAIDNYMNPVRYELPKID